MKIFRGSSLKINKDMSELTNRIRALRKHERFAEIKSKKIGLVLAGGGAKGAYQIGCLQALRSLGITTFHVISGTSVGALNAAAIASSKFHQTKQFWRSIAPWKVLRLSGGLLALFPISALAWFLSVRNKIVGVYINLGILALLLMVGLLFSSAILFFCLIPVFLLLGGERSNHATAKIGRRLIRASNSRWSLASQKRLKTEVANILLENGQPANMRCSVFVTVAREGRWFDPDFPTFEVVGPKPGDRDIHYAIDRPRSTHKWIPEYRDLRELDPENTLQILMETTALPIIFQYSNYISYRTTDGGVADNVPLLPVLNKGCDEIWIIHLSHKQNSSIIFKDAQRIMRALKLANSDQKYLHAIYIKWLKHKLKTFHKNPVSDTKDYRIKVNNFRRMDSAWDVSHFFISLIASNLNKIDAEYYNKNRSRRWRVFNSWDLLRTGRPAIIPYESMVGLPPILHIVPQESLGGFFIGTLNFHGCKARKLMKLGFQDMIHYLELMVNDRNLSLN